MVPESRRNRWLAALLAATLMIVGIAIGVAADRLLVDGRRVPFWKRQQPAWQLAMLDSELDLEEAQSQAIERLLETRWQGMAEVFRRMDPELEAIRSRARVDIRGVLTSEQQRRYDELSAEHERRRAAMRQSLELPAGQR